MSVLRVAAVSLAVGLLSGCGGGGEIAFIPPPPVPPPVNQYPSFANLTADQQIALTGATFTRTDPGQGGAFRGETVVTLRPFAGAALSISYNAAIGAYTVRNGTSTQSFGPSDLQSVQQFGPSFTTYGRSTGGIDGGSSFLGIYKPGGTGDEVPLTYTTLISFSRTSPDPSNPLKTVNDTLWAAGGFATSLSDMPRTGTATYLGPVRGLAVNASNLQGVDGTARLVADFSSASVQANLLLNRVGSSTLTVTGTGAIQSSRFGGSLSGGGFAGSFDGGFFGPQAAEMGLSFALRSDDGTQIAGAAAGRK